MTSIRLTEEFDVQLAATENSLLRRQLTRLEASYTFSLMDRVGNGILPVPRHHQRPNYRVVLSKDSPESDRIVAGALPRWVTGYPNLESSIYEFFQGCARSILQFGQRFYEVVYEPPIVQRGQILPFRIVGVVPGTVVHSCTRWVQKLPRAVARERQLPRILALDQERILRFGPPLALDGKIDRMMDSLVVHSQLAGAQFVQHNLREAANRIPFDYSVFSATESRALAAATRDIGWTPMNFLLGDGRATEHYWWHRELTFERFLAELRTAILQELNRGLQSVSHRLGIELVVMIEGLPSVEEIESVREHLLSGDWTLEEIHRAIRY
jgi:hypothetical protein